MGTERENPRVIASEQLLVGQSFFKYNWLSIYILTLLHLANKTLITLLALQLIFICPQNSGNKSWVGKKQQAKSGKRTGHDFRTPSSERRALFSSLKERESAHRAKKGEGRKEKKNIHLDHSVSDWKCEGKILFLSSLKKIVSSEKKLDLVNRPSSLSCQRFNRHFFAPLRRQRKIIQLKLTWSGNLIKNFFAVVIP